MSEWFSDFNNVIGELVNSRTRLKRIIGPASFEAADGTRASNVPKRALYQACSGVTLGLRQHRVNEIMQPS